MKQMKLWMLAAILSCGYVLTSCVNNDIDNQPAPPVPPAPSAPTDEDRVKYAEGILGVTIDRQQDWVLTSENSVKVTADAALSNISRVTVLDGNPYAGTATVLASAVASNDQSVTLTFRAPSTAEVLYAACMTDGGKCIARPFLPGEDKAVSFVEEPGEYDDSEAVTRAGKEVINPPTYKNFRNKDFLNMRNALFLNLPDGQDNRDKLTSDYENVVQLQLNDWNFYDLPVAFVGGIGKPGFESDNDNLGYGWYDLLPSGELVPYGYLLKDHFKNAFQPKYDSETKSYIVEGMYLVCKDAEGKTTTQFGPGDRIGFEMYIGDEPISVYPGDFVKVFQMNGQLFLACEDGYDMDFNDRLFWFPYGTSNLQPVQDPFPPRPTGPQTWTYAWEDKDFGDYDLNDCVIEVKENAADKSKLDVTLVALGAFRRLWLGFENKNATSYSDYIPVFDKELHEVLGVPVGTMVNTGGVTAKPVTVTISKPDYFNFQTCSFVLGCKYEDNEKSANDGDYYTVSIAHAGQDPHGIVIPGKWEWPTETTCIKDAYPKFVDWAHDIKDPTAKNWYMEPVDGKVIKR